MSRLLYVPKNFSANTLAIIDQAEDICSMYQDQGYDLTLRQLYYQFVARAIIPNKDTEYKRLGSIINDARMAGQLDWDYIVDRTRNLRDLAHWNSPAEIVSATSRQFRVDKWDDQPEYVEVWIEKDALVGVLDQVCPGEDVPYFSCRGYTSQSEMWGAAQRLRSKVADGKKVTILHLGDHDPSGIDMSRDIEDRLAVFIGTDLMRFDGFSQDDALASIHDQFFLHRIALNMDQIRQYDPPPNPAKITDSRGARYIQEYGNESWELDALEPTVLADLIRDNVHAHRDDDAWDEAVERERVAKNQLRGCAENWQGVCEFLEGDAA